MRPVPTSSAIAPARRDAVDKLRVIVLGYIVRGPMGGMAWHHLNYVLGVAQLGHEVLFVEDSDDYESCYDPSRGVIDGDPTYGLGFAAAAFQRLGLPDAWAYYDAHRSGWHGPAADRAIDFARDADVLLNVSGVNPLRPWWREIPIRVLIDTDPAFTQVRHLQSQSALESALAHNRYLTFAENVGSEDCALPDDGLPWQPTRQPIALNAWPSLPPVQFSRFTSVLQWESYPPKTHNGIRYGMKSSSFEPYWNLPGCVSAKLELCAGGPTVPRSKLLNHGWGLENPLNVTRDPWSYQHYIQQSAGEFSVAKHGYVVSRSGWFSERSACYLASGRPVIVQDTDFSKVIPAGCGLHAFDDPESAAEAIDKCATRPDVQSKAAREIAEMYFDSSRVLGELLDRVHGSVEAI
jgi:hypothetical protein